MITGWLIKLLIGFAITAVVIFDGGSILVNFFTLDSTADDIAIAVSTDIAGGTSPNAQLLEDRAEELARGSDARLIDFSIDQDQVVHVTIRRRASTLVVGKIGWIKDWARATAEGRAGRT